MSLLQKLKMKRAKRLERKLNKLLENIDTSNLSQESDVNTIVDWDKITKLSEELNEIVWRIPVYTDTTKLLPGYIVYIIGKRKPTKEKPYVTYKPEPRVISYIHDNGVNGGTTFFTFSHRIEKSQSITKDETDFQVVSEEDVIYSPHTKFMAEYICKLYNLQSKRLYVKELLKLANQNQKIKE